MGVNGKAYESEQEFWEEFHPMLDYALARYLLDHRDSLPSNISMMKFIEYSNNKRLGKVTHKDLWICEGTESLWNFHLGESHDAKTAICGSEIMKSSGHKYPNIWNTWNPDHIPVSYCKKCDEVLQEEYL